MSRTRIVGGDIIETTGGNHKVYCKENIENSSDSQMIHIGKEGGIIYGEPDKMPEWKMPEREMPESKDFEINFVLDKNEKTIVPFGIKDFKDKKENQFVKFKLKVSGDGINHWQLDIKNQEGTIYTCYSATQELSEVVIVGKSKKSTANSDKKKPQETSSTSFWAAGEYTICWDGFDSNGIYDSTRFNSKKLEAKITATKDGKQKSATVDFTTEYSQVQWTDVKIDKKSKRIDVTLRVNLTDGGANGLKCNTYNLGDEMSYETYTPTTNQPDPFKDKKTTFCDWDKIPQSQINPSQPIIKTRTRSFADLEKLAIVGLNYHWGRNKNHFIAKDIKVNNESYELYMNPINVKEKSMGGIELVYNTNGNWIRSGNPGSVKDPMSAIGTIVSRQAICYNVGYIYYLDWYEFYKSRKWDYRLDTNEDIDFKFTSAHEVGHEILKKYGGTIYSYGHKGSVNSVTQNMKDDAPAYKLNSEIDIMPYYQISPSLSLFKNYAASEKDVLGLIWLTKIEIK